MTASEARAELPELLTRVEGGEEVTITRHGRVVAVVVRPDVLRARRRTAVADRAGLVHDLLAEARGTALASAGLSADRAEELVSRIRAGRQTR